MSLNEEIKKRREHIRKQPKSVRDLRKRLMEQAMKNIVLAHQARRSRERLEKRETR